MSLIDDIISFKPLPTHLDSVDLADFPLEDVNELVQLGELTKVRIPTTKFWQLKLSALALQLAEYLVSYKRLTEPTKIVNDVVYEPNSTNPVHAIPIIAAYYKAITPDKYHNMQSRINPEPRYDLSVYLDILYASLEYLMDMYGSRFARRYPNLVPQIRELL